MATAATGTLVVGTELAGTYKLLSITGQLAAASDTITLTEATHGITTIDGVVGSLQGGLTANLSFMQVSHSGLVITIVTKKADGTTSASAFTSAIVNLLVLGH